MNRRFRENRVVVRGAGEMATAAIRRLFLAGFEVAALEQAAPDCIRRKVCFAEAIHEKKITIEGVTAKFAVSVDEATMIIGKRYVPVLIDPRAELLPALKASALIDARMLKKDTDAEQGLAPVVIGLGPGFIAGKNCHAAIETNRGFDLGRVIYNGSTHTYTGKPSPINGVAEDRVIRSPAEGVFKTVREIGEKIAPEDVVGEVAGNLIASRIAGVIRGLARDGLKVVEAQKIGDVDPRGIRDYCFKISDKANAVAGGVLEAVFALGVGSELNKQRLFGQK